MKVAFVIPPSKFLLNEYVYPSLGILYVAAAARRAGYDAFCVIPGIDELDNTIDADVVCVTGTTPQFDGMVDVAKANRGKRLIAGGPHASADPKSLIEAGYDTVVIGEGEEAIVEALEGRKGIFASNRIKTLDELDWPARDLIPMERYAYDLQGHRSTYIMANRGCSWKCGFCSKPWDKDKVTRRTVDSVVEEAVYLRDKLGFTGIMFFDDVFTMNIKWLTEFCEKIKPTGLVWRCFLRADTAKYDKMKMMKDAGCIEVGVGVESGSNKILKNINKGETVEANTMAREICRQVGIRFKSFFIVGLPGETYETVQETKQWIIDNQPEGYSLFVFVPLPGAPIYEAIKRGSTEYDYVLDILDYKHRYWGGIMTDQISPGHTSELSRHEIVRLRNEMAAELGRIGIMDRNNILGGNFNQGNLYNTDVRTIG